MTSRRDFSEFYESEFPIVFKTILALSEDRESARDMAQEAFGRAYARWRRLSRHDWAGAWVMTTALNLFRQDKRRARRRAESFPATERESDFGHADQRLDVLAAVRGLPKRQRDVVLLHYVIDLPVTAVSELLGITDGAVKAHLFKARAHLKFELGVRDDS